MKCQGNRGVKEKIRDMEQLKLMHMKENIKLKTQFAKLQSKCLQLRNFVDEHAVVSPDIPAHLAPEAGGDTEDETESAESARR